MSTKKIIKTKTKPLASFYLAEEMRLEIDGKVSAMGLFTDFKVMIPMPREMPNPTTEQPIHVKSLSLLFCISNVNTDFLVKIEIESGGNRKELIPSFSHKPIEFGKSSNIVVALSPLVVADFGDKYIFINIDSNEFMFKFEINRIEQNNLTGQIKLN